MNCPECIREATGNHTCNSPISFTCDKHLLSSCNHFKKLLDNFSPSHKKQYQKFYEEINAIYDYLHLEITVRGLTLVKHG
jgi:hypothetical protein